MFTLFTFFILVAIVPTTVISQNSSPISHSPEPRLVSQTTDPLLSTNDSTQKLQITNDSFVHFLNEVGLSYDSVTAITIDKRAGIWVGSKNGLWIFDSLQFREFTYKDGLFDKNIHQLFYSNDDFLWVATSSGPFVLLDNHFYLFEPLKNHKILSISENNDNWLFLTEKGLHTFKKDKSFFESMYFIIPAISLLLITTGVLVYFGIKKFKTHLEWKANLTRVEQQALLAQMNPHFIFNSLNSVQRYIMANDKESAHTYLQKFASLIRKVLENSSQPTITLGEEIDMLKLYLQIESSRFDDGFDFEISVQDDDIWQYEIPTMLLQTFVENAVWHGLMNKESRGKINLRFSRMDKKFICCEIEDNGIGRKKAAAKKSKESVKHKSKGTRIVKKRIELLNLKAQQKIRYETIDLEQRNSELSGTLVRLEIPVVLT